MTIPNMKSILLSIVFGCLFLFSSAQSLKWLNPINEGGTVGFDHFTTVDKQGNIYQAGRFAQQLIIEGQDYSDVSYDGHYIIKYNAARQQQWVRIIGGGEELMGLNTDAEDNLIVTLYSRGSVRFEDNYIYQPDWGYLGRGEAFIIKFNRNGERLWVQSSAKSPDTPIESMGDETYPYKSSQVDNDGNIYQLGIFYGSLAFDSTVVYGELYRPNPYVVKLDKNGKIVWLKTMTYTGFPLGYSMLKNELVFSMYINNKFSPDKNRYALIKWDLNGNITMDRTIKNDSTLATTRTTSNDKFIYLSTIVYTKKDTLDENFQKISVSKLDASGNVIWDKTFKKQAQENWFSIESIHTDTLDNLYLIGRGPNYWWDIDSADHVNIEKYTLKAGDEFIAKMNPDGALEWLHNFKYGSGVHPWSISPYDKKSLLFTGSFIGSKITILDSIYYPAHDRAGFTGILDYSAIPTIPSSTPPVSLLQEYTLINGITDTITKRVSAPNYTLKIPADSAAKPSLGQLVWKDSQLCYQPDNDTHGIDSFVVRLCHENNGNCYSIKFRINLKDSLEIIKRRSIIKPDSLLTLNLFSLIEDPNKGLLQLQSDSLHWPRYGYSEAYTDGSFLYIAQQGFLGNDTLGINICSYTPDFPNDVPICTYLHYDIIVNIITALPDGPPVTSYKNVTFYPNPAANQVQVNMPLVSYRKLQVYAVDTKGELRSLQFSFTDGKITIQRGNVGAGIYIICVKVDDKIYSGKVIFLD